MRKRSRMIDIKKNVLSKRSLSVWPRPSKIYVRDPRSIYWSAPTNFMLEISPIRYIYWRPAVIISVMDTTINQLNELRRQGIITEQAYADALGVINSRERAPIPAPRAPIPAPRRRAPIPAHDEGNSSSSC